MVIISCIPSDGLGTFCRPQRCPYVIGRIPLRQHNSPSIAACLLFQHTTTAITLSTPATPSDEELDQSNLALEAPSDVDSRTRTSSTSRCIGSNSSINATTSVAALEDDDTPRLSLWQGRLLIIAAAAIYGTNFATVKVLDVSMTVGSAAAARFTIAAAAVCLPIWVQETTNHLRSSKQMVDVTASSIKLIKGDDDNTMYSNQTDGRWPATWFGAEVGAWYCIGYIFQALGLETVDAGKVRRMLLVEVCLKSNDT